MFIIPIKSNLRIKLEKLYTYNTIFNHSINILFFSNINDSKQAAIFLFIGGLFVSL